jgi:formylmethanofuran dehydrogenase subunit E
VDGLQLATGATYGKRNIELIPADEVRVIVRSTDTGEALEFRLVPGLPDQFAAWLAAEGDEAASRRARDCAEDELFTATPC